MCRKLFSIRSFAVIVLFYLFFAFTSAQALTDARKDKNYMNQVKCACVVCDDQPTEIVAYILYDDSGEYHCTLIPMLQILSRVGWNVEKTDRNIYAIRNTQDTFLFSTTDGTLYRQGEFIKSANYLELPPDSLLKGTIGVFIDDEYYIDTESVSGFLLRSGWKVSVDTEELIVYVTRKPIYVLPSE